MADTAQHNDHLLQFTETTIFGKPLIIERVAGGRLFANAHFPPQFQAEEGKTWPAVVLLHGFGGSRHEINGLFIRTAAELALSGFLVFRFDFRGAGETGGSTLDLTLESQIEDTAEVFEYLKDLDYVDDKKIALLGFSFGGLTAACLAAQRTDVAALALWEAVFDMKSVMKRLYGPTAIKSVRARGYMQAGMVQLSPQFFDVLDEHNPTDLMASYSAPVLLVQGCYDTIVTVETVYQWKRALQRTKADLHLIADADHGFTKESWSREAIDVTRQWLSACLIDAKQP